MKYKTSLLLLLLLSCSAPPPAMTPRAANVYVANPVVEEVPITLEAIGNIYPMLNAQIKPQISGILLETVVQYGQTVQNGDLLFTIDPRPYQAILEKAKATLVKDESGLVYAQQKLDRYSKLIEDNYVSKLTLEQHQNDLAIAKAQIEIDKADIQQAEINLSYCFIRAPFDGRVGNLPIDPGNLVSPNDVLTQISQLSPAQVYFYLPENQFFEIRQLLKEKSLHIDIFHPARKETTFPGILDFADNQIDLSTGTLLMKGRVDNENLYFWPGEFVRVRILLRKEPQAVVIPAKSIQQGEQGKFVYVVKPDMTAEVRPIEVIAEFNSHVAVKDHLSPEDKVVIQGQLNVSPGAKVNIMSKK